MEHGERLVLHHAAFVMSRFRPWIGEIEVNDLADGFGQTKAHELRRIIVKHAHVLDLTSTKPIRSVPEELIRPFDAEEIRVRLALRLLNQERALAGTDLQFESSFRVREPRPRIDNRRPAIVRIIWREILPTYAISLDGERSPMSKTETHRVASYRTAESIVSHRGRGSMPSCRAGQVVRSSSRYARIPRYFPWLRAERGG